MAERRGAHEWRVRLRERYYGWSPRAVRFLYALLAFDLVVIGFVIVSSFFFANPVVEVLDLVFGIVILADFGARLLASRSPLNELVHPLGLADLIVIVSFLAPLAGENFAFLRIARALRLFRSYQLVSRLRQDFPFFKRNEDAVLSVVNLMVFLLIMTALVHATQIGRNPAINNYVDALYFTVTTLTTTGFGDITLQGTERPPARGHDHDFRGLAVHSARPDPVPAAEGALRVPRVRPHPPRSGCRALQALRRDHPHPDGRRRLSSVGSIVVSAPVVAPERAGQLR